MNEQAIIDRALSGEGFWILTTVLLAVAQFVDWLDRRGCRECKARRAKARENKHWDGE